MNPEVTSVCAEYLATARPVRTMTNAELTDRLRTADVDPGEFSRILDLNDSFGGLQLPTPDPRPSIFHTIGIPPRLRINRSATTSVPFFDFGVAAPCGIEILGSGAVVADFSNDLPPVKIADSFEVFLEGLAHEWLAPQLFETSDGREFQAASPTRCTVFRPTAKWLQPQTAGQPGGTPTTTSHGYQRCGTTSAPCGSWSGRAAVSPMPSPVCSPTSCTRRQGWCLQSA